MNILIVMIPLSMLLMVGAAIAFFWAVDNDQFDDMETPALLPLMDQPEQTTESVEVRAQTTARTQHTDLSEPPA